MPKGVPQNEWPREIKRGPLKGQSFDSQTEYDEARKLVPDDEETPPATPEAGPAPASARRGGRSARGRVDKAMVVSILFPLNIGLYLLPQTRTDALTDEEIDRLAEAIVRVAAVNKHVERAILTGASSSAYVELAIVVGAIAVKRAANHGVIPRELGTAIDATVDLGGMPDAPAPTPTVNGYAEAAQAVVGA